jgi:syntaxin 5
MCDRTQEFLKTIQQLNSNSGLNLVKKSKAVHDVPKSKTAFNDAASDIARSIHKTSQLLTKLTNLVRRQGLFDDPTDEINSLIHRIKQDLDELNTKCDSAQQFIETKKSVFGNDKTHQSAEHNVKVVSHLKSDLMSTTKDFKTVLELRSSKMKDQQQRKVQLIGNSALSPLRQIEYSFYDNSKETSNTSSNTNEESPVKKSNSQLPNPYSDSFHFNNNNNNNNSIPRSFENQQQQQQLLLAPIAETQYFDSREKAVTEVEKTIGELGQLFKRLATMIAEQQELVERIDEDIENSADNAEKAHNILLKTYEKVSSNRGLYLKIFGILGLFALFFFLFLL